MARGFPMLQREAHGVLLFDLFFKNKFEDNQGTPQEAKDTGEIQIKKGICLGIGFG